MGHTTRVSQRHRHTHRYQRLSRRSQGCQGCHTSRRQPRPDQSARPKGVTTSRRPPLRDEAGAAPVASSQGSGVLSLR